MFTRIVSIRWLRRNNGIKKKEKGRKINKKAQRAENIQIFLLFPRKKRLLLNCSVCFLLRDLLFVILDHIINNKRKESRQRKITFVNITTNFIWIHTIIKNIIVRLFFNILNPHRLTLIAWMREKRSREDLAGVEIWYLIFF
jgi:hypothetical protein